MTELTKTEYKKANYVAVSFLMIFFSVFILSLGLADFNTRLTIRLSIAIYGVIGIILGVITFLGVLVMEDEDFK